MSLSSKFEQIVKLRVPHKEPPYGSLQVLRVHTVVAFVFGQFLRGLELT